MKRLYNGTARAHDGMSGTGRHSDDMDPPACNTKCKNDVSPINVNTRKYINNVVQ
jgi:hypothetical protein